MIEITKDEGRVVIMDWHMQKLSLRGRFMNWIGEADMRKPTWKYLQGKVKNFYLNHSFNLGGVFVAAGSK